MLNIIELMAQEDRGFSLNEMARTLHISVNSVYRICTDMVKRGYFDRDPDTGLYSLGTRFFTLGQRVGSRLDLRNKALPLMRELSRKTGETVHLCLLRENWLVLLDQVETRHPIGIHVETGSLMKPHASAFGKCLLAYCSLEERERILSGELAALTPQTITSAPRLKKELERIRQRGFAYDLEEYMEGVRCIGAPIHGAKGLGIAAMGIMAPAYRLDEERLREYTPLVKEYAAKISAAMGYLSRQLS